ncbi:MAG: hypothetical protein HOQ22_12590 [Nocardioidaceae bacterium]|nr:hypothetical protein [Nocardioidaceae bacterium]NUS51859.1 hypothetical protein [Nocardioidaceae bacterium]
MGALDAAMFVIAGVSSVWLAYLLLRESLRPNWQVVLLVVFWFLVAYLVLPRLHRILTRLYLPGYFIGRARTSDGLLGDPVNIALLGDEAQVHRALTAAGWTRADDVNLASSRRIVASTLSRRSYPEAPVSPLHLFDRVQDFAYQQEVAGNPAKRHHVRFWRCPGGWLLPGGHAVDWVAAGTYDRSVGLSLMTFQVTHRIASDIDAERDFTVRTMTDANPEADVEVIENFSTGYHDRNGGGDAIKTDGHLPVVDLRAVPTTPEPVAGPAGVQAGGRAWPPAPTAFGAGVAVLRGLLGIPFASLLLAAPETNDALPADLEAGAVVLAAVMFLFVGLLDIALGVATYLGHNWSRVSLMVLSVLAIVTTLGSARPTLGSGLPSIGLSILVLLALSSHRARDYALARSGRRAALVRAPERPVAP